MNNEMSGINSVEPESINSLQECYIKPDTVGPTSLKDIDINEASLPCMAVGRNNTPKKRCHENKPVAPLHVHEVQGLIETAQQGSNAHNHRLMAVSSDPKPLGENNHFHEVIFCTDYHDGFCHEGWGTTSGAFPVGDGHVHFLEGITTTDDWHWHKYRIATSLDGIFG
jgi:hypothetical protein